MGGSASIKAFRDRLLALRRPWNNGGLRPFGTKWTNKLRHAENGPPSASAWRCLSTPPTALRIYILHGNGIRWRKMRNVLTVCDHFPQRWKQRADTRQQVSVLHNDSNAVDGHHDPGSGGGLVSGINCKGGSPGAFLHSSGSTFLNSPADRPIARSNSFDARPMHSTLASASTCAFIMVVALAALSTATMYVA